MTYGHAWAPLTAVCRRAAGAVLACAVVLAIMPISIQAQTYTLLYVFPSDGSQGISPNSPLIRDEEGNLYGTTQAGGGPGGGGRGTLFRLNTDGTTTLLHVFNDVKSGLIPSGILLRDRQGNFYGTTFSGGHSGGPCGSFGCGVVFKLSVLGQLTVLHSFVGPDGNLPLALIRDAAGNLYGATLGGGIGCNNNGSPGCGVVFRLSAKGEFTVLYRFRGGSDGSAPSSLTRDSLGNLYGATYNGGGLCDGFLTAGCGIVFRLDPAGSETVLHRFTHFAEGLFPWGPLLLDREGNIYGTATSGGLPDTCTPGGCGTVCSIGCGVVFKIDPAGNETPVYRFKGGADGAIPASGVLRDRAGNFYGETTIGGTGGCDHYGDTCGVIFKLDAQGNETVLYSFQGETEGGSGNGLTRDREGNLYGGGSGGDIPNTGNCFFTGCGVIFKITP